MGKLKKAEYLEALEPMQRELVGLARWVTVTGARIVVLFEGRDTAGKGGAIDAIREHINPRQCRGRRARQAERPRARRVVLPALCGALAGSRRDRAVRPFAGTTAPGSSR